MTRIYLIATALACLLSVNVEIASAVAPQGVVVLDFDDIQVFPHDYIAISGTDYHGLSWGTSSIPGFKGNPGFWIIDNSNGDPLGQGLVNAWAASELGIQFPAPMRLISTLASAQGTQNLSATGVRFQGFRNGQLVATSPWFRNLVRHSPALFTVDFPLIDSLVVQTDASPDAAADGASWGGYRLDNFTFAFVPEPGSEFLLVSALLLLLARCRSRRN